MSGDDVISTSAPSRRIPLLLAALAATLLLGAGPARAADPAPAGPAVAGEVVVTPDAGGAAAPVTVDTRPGESVQQAVARLRDTPGVRDAVPNYIAHAAAATPYVPNDPGLGSTIGAWQDTQWNFAGPYGVGAPQAWGNLRAAGRAGGKGVLVTVLDTGVAYTSRGGAVRSPDLRSSTFVRGWDFVADDNLPQDRNGHGTHVASTIAEATNNGVGLTGLAYGARILPVRVLDDRGEGDATTIARGVRYAVRRGAKVINLSLEFGSAIRAKDIPQLLAALREADRRGVLVVAASGNEGARSIVYPARAPHVVSVGATTEHGCLSVFSNRGRGLDIAAPGGGADARVGGDPQCDPSGEPGRDISQVTLVAAGSRTFGVPQDYEGTSMAAPHVSATAALVIASGVLGRDPTPRQVEVRLKRTARDLGPAGFDRIFGAGLLDAARATSPDA